MSDNELKWAKMSHKEQQIATRRQNQPQWSKITSQSSPTMSHNDKCELQWATVNPKTSQSTKPQGAILSKKEPQRVIINQNDPQKTTNSHNESL